MTLQRPGIGALKGWLGRTVPVRTTKRRTRIVALTDQAEALAAEALVVGVGWVAGALGS